MWVGCNERNDVVCCLFLDAAIFSLEFMYLISISNAIQHMENNKVRECREVSRHGSRRL